MAAGAAVPITRAPRATANCAAVAPTLPAAPCTSTVSPARTAVAASVWTAVPPTAWIPAATSQLTAFGLGTTRSARAVTAVA